MKYRLDLVTNSSSSSYTCDICGENICGMNISLHDGEMYQCEEGHIFCEEYMSKNPDHNLKEVILEKIQSKIEYYQQKINEYPENENYIEWLEDKKQKLEYVGQLDNQNEELDDLKSDYGIRCELPTSYCPICSFEVISKSELTNYLEKLYKVPRIEVFNEIRRENKRRKKLYDSEYIDYVCKKYNRTKEEIEQEIHNKFHNYEEFLKFENLV